MLIESLFIISDDLLTHDQVVTRADEHGNSESQTELR